MRLRKVKVWLLPNQRVEGSRERERSGKLPDGDLSAKYSQGEVTVKHINLRKERFNFNFFLCYL